MEFMKIKINNYYLDDEQMKIALSDSNYILVVAGAGSGKTLTILGKIWYLINYKKSNPSEILCISYTKEASDSLKKKIKNELNVDIDVYTFHKLSIELLKKGNIDFLLTDSLTLDRIIHKYLYIDILNYPVQIKYLSKILGINPKKYYEYIINNEKKIKKYEKIIKSFINLFKTQGKDDIEFLKLIKKVKKRIIYNKKNIYLLIIIFNIYMMYHSYLSENNEKDFDDIIKDATYFIDSSKINLNYKYIIIDEYQDSSFLRFKLIKKLIDVYNCKLLVVGDDFQSIYRFSGSELNLFTNFKKYFQNAEILKIQSTYRNSLELVQIAGNFVMQNKMQICKNMKSSKHLDYPINIIYYEDEKKDFILLLNYLVSINQKKLLILGRNNNDINNYIDSKFINSDGSIIFNGLNIKYMTIHKSKGLEEENVIIINLRNNQYGFPSQIKNHKVIDLLNPPNKYRYDEERRLFYVALTRTKNYCYLFVPKNRKSIFIKELEYFYKEKIKTITLK